jgi:hypothetical protein
MPVYIYREESGYDERFTAADDEAAETRAREMLREGDWNQDRSTATFRVRASIAEIVTENGEEYEENWRTVAVTFEPDEPACITDCTGGHDWQTPYELVGGIRDNPGVRANGGGVTIDYACVLCGARKHVNTWDTDPATGAVMETVSYDGPGYYDLSLLAAESGS